MLDLLGSLEDLCLTGLLVAALKGRDREKKRGSRISLSKLAPY
jgi:hypothetical protein